MIIYGITENLRNLLADQNYVQKYSSVPTEREAKRSIWIAMLIYIPLTAVFLYIGTTLFAFYSLRATNLQSGITKGDEVFPYFIATQLPAGLKGLNYRRDYRSCDEHRGLSVELLGDCLAAGLS